MGLGNASWLYAEHNSSLKFITHTHAINSIGDLQLVAGCETNQELAMAWSRKFGLPVFSELSQVNFNVDLVVIAVDHAALLDVTLAAIKRWPSSKILVEKPLITSEAQLELLQTLAEIDLERIWINFPRNFQPETAELRKLIMEHLAEGKDQRLKWNGSYSGGFLNTSSHFISLINYLFGKYHLRLISENANSAMQYSIDGTLVEGSMLEVDSIVSTGSMVISGTGFNIQYLDGGQEILVKSSIHGEFKISTTRSQYQLEVYRKLLEIWAASESNFGTLSSEMYNLRQMIYLQNSRGVQYGSSH